MEIDSITRSAVRTSGGSGTGWGMRQGGMESGMYKKSKKKRILTAIVVVVVLAAMVATTVLSMVM